ncbi:MAG TPA: 3-oxoacyl-ACP synthase [bacterium]|jgi:3-oxoacyl-[acyl-carrier-protein] synthase-3
MPRVGITAMGTYIPPAVQRSDAIAAASGIPEEVIIQKFGLRQKHIASPDEHVSDMALHAARAALEGIDPRSIGAVIYFGSAHKDYYLWTCAPRLQHELALVNAFTFELMDTSACGPVALKVAKDMLVADRDLTAILLAGASREAAIIDYRNPRSRFAFSFADGAAAAVLQRDSGHEVLASAIVTDGSFWRDVLVPAGGSVHPASEQTVRQGMHFLDVIDPQGMKARLDPVALDRFVGVITEAVTRSGFTVADIDYLAALHTKRSLFDALLRVLGLEESQSFYLADYGHMSAIDPLISLVEGERAGRLRRGDLAVAVSGGTGYSWAATAIRW